MVKFRFQDLKIWQSAIEIADELFDIADEIEKRGYTDSLSNSGLLVCPCRIISQKDLNLHQKESSRIF